MSNRFKILIAGVLGLTALAMTDGGMKYIQKIVGVYSQQNFMVNGDFEKNKYGVTLQGTVGSATTSLVDDPAIYGNALEITSPSDGLEILLPIDAAIEKLSGLNCEGKIHANLFSANTEPMILEVDVVRGTSTNISNVQRVTLQGSGIYPGSGWKPISVNFPCAAVTSASYIRVKVIDAGVVLSGSIVFELDSAYAGEATNITNQVVVTDWQDFPSVAAGTLITATTTSPTYGTVAINKAQYRYVGSDVEVKWDYRQTNATGANNGSGVYLFNIPSSICVINTAKVAANAGISTRAQDVNATVGEFGTADLANDAEGSVYVHSSSQLKASYIFAGGSQGRNWFGSSASLFVTGATISLSLRAKVPCVGRSATQSAITQQCIQDGSCENVFSAHVAADGTVSSENIDWINGNASISDTSLYTIPVKISNSAAMNCEANVSIAGFDGGNLTARTEGTQTASNIYVRTGFTNSGNLNFTKGVYPFRIICQRTSTDYKPRFAAPVLVGSVTSNAQSALRIEGAKISSTGVVTEIGGSDWISGNCSGTSPYACTINSGVFSSAPVCTATSGVGASFAAEVFTVLTSTAFTIQKIGNNAGATEVICIGAR